MSDSFVTLPSRSAPKSLMPSQIVAMLQPVRPAILLLDAPTSCCAMHIEKQTIFARLSVQTINGISRR